MCIYFLTKLRIWNKNVHCTQLRKNQSYKKINVKVVTKIVLFSFQNTKKKLFCWICKVCYKKKVVVKYRKQFNLSKYWSRIGFQIGENSKRQQWNCMSSEEQIKKNLFPAKKNEANKISLPAHAACMKWTRNYLMFEMKCGVTVSTLWTMMLKTKIALITKNWIKAGSSSLSAFIQQANKTAKAYIKKCVL